MKALAPPCMPAIIWRHLAPELAGPIHAALERHWCAETVAPPSHWLDGWLHLIPKPGKPSTQPAALRPLCLQHPILKIVSKILTNLIKQHAYPTLMCLPLYAYLPQRGTTECLLRVSQHCQQIRQLCRDRQTDDSPHGLFGGMQVSLDMEKAFDTVRRDLVLHALNQINLPPDVLRMIQTWLAPHKYHIPFKSLVGTIDASRGIKQGSTDAPILWTLCMYLITQELLQRYSHAWLHDHLIVYADDVHLRWTLNSTADGQCALGDLAHILHTFRSYGFNINATKSVVLFRAVGKGVSKFTRRWISRSKHGPQLLIPDTLFRLPMVAKTAYLIPWCDPKLQGMGNRYYGSTYTGRATLLLHPQAVAPGAIHTSTCALQVISTVCCAYSSVRGSRDGIACNHVVKNL